MAQLADGWAKYLRNASRQDRKPPISAGLIHGVRPPSPTMRKRPDSSPNSNDIQMELSETHETQRDNLELRSPPAPDRPISRSDPTQTTTRSRARPPDSEFDRGKITPSRPLFDPQSASPTGQSRPMQGEQPQQHQKQSATMTRSQPSKPAVADTELSKFEVNPDRPHASIQPQPKTRPISQDELIAEVKGIYAGLVMIEGKCIEVDNAQSRSKYRDLNSEQWIALVTLHRTLLHEHREFFTASQHPSADIALRRLASKCAMPAQMRRSGIHGLLEGLQLPRFSDDMLGFISTTYRIMDLLYETNPDFADSWIECIGDLARYRRALEEEDLDDDVQMTGRASSRTPGKAPTIGQLYKTLSTSDEHPSAKMLNLLFQDERGRRSSVSSQRTVFNVDGIFNGVAIEANADTGAAFNVISKRLVESMGLKLQPGTEGYIVLPSGKTTFSPGLVKGSFKFGFTAKAHDLSLIVLEKATHALVLGSKFLRLAHAFTKYKNCLKKVVSNIQSFGLRLLGDDQDAVAGYLNGAACLAVPDSGSDIMVLSGAFAEAYGLKVQRGSRHRTWVEFIDGSRGRTDGIVRDAMWQFREGGEHIRLDFYVIDNLPVDAILSSALVDEHDVFSRYDDLLVPLSPKADSSGVYNIRLVERAREDIEKLEDSFFQDMTCDTPFTPEIVQRELVRRDQIRDRIKALPEDERQDHTTHEHDRRRRFDEEWAKHRRRMAAAVPPVLAGPASFLAPTNGKSSDAGRKGMSGFLKKSRLKIIPAWPKSTS